MILTCPECATSYFVDDERIPAAGRKVKCANCDARWTAVRDAPAAEAALEAEPEDLAEPVAASAPEPAPEPADEMFGDLAVAPADPTPEPELEIAPRTRPRRAPSKSQPKPTAGLIALCVVSAVALTVAVAIALRGQIVKALPAAAPVFALAGLNPATTELVIDGVRSQAAFQGETPVLSVTGAVRNPGAESARVPPIRVRLLDRAGKAVAVRTATPEPAEAPAHATRYFVVILPDPPSTAVGMEVDFAPSVPPAPPAAKADTPAGHD